MSIPTQYEAVTITTKANVFFDGGVISHTILLEGKVKKTVGVMRPGTYHFNVGVAERMEMIAGGSTATVDGQDGPREYPPGTSFEIPANGGFTISIASGLCEYICHYR
jgi:purine/pyrimidine-nucleoside phosphorylase